MEKLPVIFRKESDGFVVAIFPTLAEGYDNYYMTCYAHIGQHGVASLDYYYETSPASPDEYAPLLAELRAIYESGHYDAPVKLDVKRRRSPAMHRAWLANATAMGNA